MHSPSSTSSTVYSFIASYSAVYDIVHVGHFKVLAVVICTSLCAQSVFLCLLCSSKGHLHGFNIVPIVARCCWWSVVDIATLILNNIMHKVSMTK